MNKRLAEVIDQAIQEVLLENPATVNGPDGQVAQCGEDNPAIAFKGMKHEGDHKLEFIWNDRRHSGGPAWHGEIRMYPSVPSNEVLRGRLWSDIKVASFYQPEEVVARYHKDVEKWFDEVGEDITTYQWDFDDSGYNGLVPWPWKHGSKSGKAAVEIPPAIQKQINDLLPQFHLAAPGPEKDRLQKQLDDLYKQAGVENQKEKQKAAYQAASAEKKTPFEKGGGAGMASYRGRLPALETAILAEQVLSENPDTMNDVNTGLKLTVYDGPAVSFYCIVDDNLGKHKWFYHRNDHGAAWHNEIVKRATTDFPDPWSGSDRYLRGRRWLDENVCTFYFTKSQFGPTEVERVEELFKILGLRLEDFKFEFSNSARTDGLVPWPFGPTKKAEPKPEPKPEVSPEDQKKIDRINSEIAELQATLHLKVGAEKKAVEDKIERLEQMIGKIGGVAARKAAYQAATADKIAPFEKGAGSVAAYKGSLPALEEKKARIYNKTLSPVLWTTDRPPALNPDVRSALLQIALDFYMDTELKGKVQDVQLLGSAANYNWTPQSDLDVHILVDGTQVGMKPEDVEKYFRAMVGKWNVEHDIEVKGHPIELYLQDVNDKTAATAIYSLLNSQWVKEPKPQDVSVDKAGIQKKYTMWVEKINHAIKSNDEKMLKKILEGLKKCRQAGLDERGEFSTENLVFKILRARGFIDKLRDFYNKIYDKKMSVTEVGFDPQSQAGPNADAGTNPGSDNGDFYQRMNDTMKKMEEGALGQLNPNEIGVDLRQTLAAYNNGELKPKDFEKEVERLMWKGRLTDPDNAELARQLLKRFRAPKTGIKLREVGMKDLKSRQPRRVVMTDEPKLETLTLDNLKALRDKSMRFYMAAKDANDEGEIERAKAVYQMFHDEIKKRLKGINEPVAVPTEPNPEFKKPEDFMGEATKKPKIPNQVDPKAISRPDEKSYESNGYWISPKGKVYKVGTFGHNMFMLWYVYPELEKGSLQQPFRAGTNKAFSDGWVRLRMERDEIEVEPDIASIAPTPRKIVDDIIQRNKLKMVRVGTLAEGKNQEALHKDFKIGHFTVKFGEPDIIPGAGKARIGDEVFMNVVKMGPDWGKYANQWVVNKDAGAFRMGLKEWPKGYATPEELVQDVDKWVSSRMTNEGYGSGVPERDRLKITDPDGSVERWRIRSKDAPKTPKMPTEVMDMVNEALDAVLPMPVTEGVFLLEAPTSTTLKKNKIELTDKERKEVMKHKAVWHHGPGGKASPAIWKAEVKGKIWYCCNTHRAIQVKSTLKAAIKAFDFIKTTA